MPEQTVPEPSLANMKKDVFDYVRAMLADGMVDVELDPFHYEQAIKQAFIRYRQRSSASVEESHAFLTLDTNKNEYYLPQEVISVRQIFKRTTGSSSSGGANFDPFSAGFLNMYLLSAGQLGGLLNFELYSQYQNLTAMMFGGFLNYTYNQVTKKLTIVRNVQSDGEVVLLWVYNHKPDVAILNSIYSGPWIRDYTLAMCKMMLGEGRGKYSQIAGPQGGTSLNGAALKAEAATEMENLEKEIMNFVDGGQPLTFVRG
jgi:hypothetical protein